MDKKLLKQQELKTLTERLVALQEIVEGKEGVQARALNDTEKTERNTIVGQIGRLKTEIVELEADEKATEIARAARAANKPTTVEEKTAKKWSMLRAARLAVARHRGEELSDSEYKVEKDMHQEAVRLGAAVDQDLSKGCAFPDFVRDYQVARATVGTANNAGNLVTQVMDYTDAANWLQPQTMLEKAGAMVIPNLTGVFTLPAGDTPGTYGYNSENGAAAAPGSTWKTKSVAPKRGAVSEPVSLLLLAETSQAVEMMFTMQFGALEAQGIERVAFHGGATNEPTGISATSGVPKVYIGTNGGALTEAKWDEAVATIKANNGLTNPLIAFVRPEIAHKMTSITRDAGSGKFLLNDETYVAKHGIKTMESNLIITNGVRGTSSDCMPIYIADWTKLKIFKWKFSQFTVDNLTAAGTGNIILTYNSFNNVYWAHDKNFVVIPDARNV